MYLGLQFTRLCASMAVLNKEQLAFLDSFDTNLQLFHHINMRYIHIQFLSCFFHESNTLNVAVAVCI